MYGPSAAERIAMARRLLARNRLQEAIDILNEAVRQDPRFPDTFETRAEAFEMMGMFPHAAADRRKAAELRATYQPAATPPPPPVPQPQAHLTALPHAEPAAEEPPVIEPVPPPTIEDEPADDAAETAGSEDPEADPEHDDVGEPDAVAEVLEESGVDEAAPVASSEPAPIPSFIDPDAPREVATPQPRGPEPEPEYIPTPEPQYAPEPAHERLVPAYVGPPRPSVSGAMLRAASVVLFALGIFVAAGVGIYLAFDAVGGDDNPSVGVTATPAAGGAATNDPAATADAQTPGTVEDALRGDPFGFSSVQTAWETADFAVTVGDFSQEVTGFSEPAVDLTIARDGLQMQMSILMYDGGAALENDWSLSVPVAPRLEGVVPVGSRAWYNANVVVIVRVTDETLYEGALEAFLDMG
ncbi:MAG TPA: hypothetical protein VMR52_05745 [Dehalococcoidia bacterium]|nr:hypothetical protein [Dehalococcoidia bacterium]